jgi:peptidoglycan/LPS O-acetylase OafA/YrhL
VLFAAFVVFSHSFALGMGNDELEPLAWMLNRVLGQAITLGELAVDGFFVISGYLIAKSWEKRVSALDYLGKRVRRIYPGFIVAALIGVYLVPYAAVNVPNWTHVDLWDFVARTIQLRDKGHPFAFSSNVYPGVTNGSLWSISYEFWCYIGVAALGIFGMFSRRKLLLVLFGFSLLAAYLFAITDWRPGGGFFGKLLGYPPAWARLLPFYLVGVLAYRYRDLLQYSHAGAITVIAATLLLGLVDHSWSFVLPVSWAYLIFYVAFFNKVKPLAATAYGDCSYGAYLYAFPIQQLCVMAAGGSMHPLLLFMISLPLSLAAGLLSWHLVEKWFLPARIASLPRSSSLVPANR